MLPYPEIDPVAFNIGPFSVHWYGMMYLFAFCSAYMLMRYRAAQPNSGWKNKEVSDLIFYAALGVILGGRMGYFLFYTSPTHWIENPQSIFYIWEGGMSFHGGLLGVVIAMAFWGKAVNKPLLSILDFGAPTVPVGLLFGRLGNFIGGELWGRTAPDLPWAMVFPRAGNIPRHPSQLYEMALEGFVLFAILWIFSNKPRKTGMVSGLFILGYGIFRFFIEFFREPDAHISFIALDWVTMGHLLSTPMILGGLLLLLSHRVPLFVHKS